MTSDYTLRVIAPPTSYLSMGRLGAVELNSRSWAYPLRQQIHSEDDSS